MKSISLAAVLAAATLAVPMIAQPASAAPHHGWRKVCSDRWGPHHHRVHSCRRVRY